MIQISKNIRGYEKSSRNNLSMCNIRSGNDASIVNDMKNSKKSLETKLQTSSAVFVIDVNAECTNLLAAQQRQTLCNI